MFIPNFNPPVNQILNAVDKEEIIVLFQVWQITSVQTGQATGSLKWSIPNMKSGSHVNISR